MKKSKSLSFFITFLISTSVIANFTMTCERRPFERYKAFDNLLRNEQPLINQHARIDLSLAKQYTDQQSIPDAVNANLYLSNSSFRWHNERGQWNDENFICFDTVTSCTNINEGISITDEHAPTFRSHKITKESNFDPSWLNSINFSDRYGWMFYGDLNKTVSNSNNNEDNIFIAPPSPSTDGSCSWSYIFGYYRCRVDRLAAKTKKLLKLLVEFNPCS